MVNVKLCFMPQHDGGTHARESADCDEARIRADERLLHLPEQMQVVAAHGQHLLSTLQVNLRGFIVMAPNTADRAQIHDDRAMDLRELLRVELLDEVFER